MFRYKQRYPLNAIFEPKCVAVIGATEKPGSVGRMLPSNLKAGRTQAAAQAATSHTGALTGSQEAFEAACRRSGVLTVTRIDELFSLAEALERQPRPRMYRAC